MTLPATCPLCGSASGTELFDAADPLSGDRFPLRRCTSCSLVYVVPRPDDHELPQYYPDDYYGRRHRFFNATFMDLRVRALPSTPGRVLDIGCGRGDFLLACRRAGWDVVGVEQDAAPILQPDGTPGSVARPIEVIATNRLGDLADGSFDAVTLWHVLEHLPNPRATLAHVLRVLGPGGRLVIEVPNFASWQARMSPVHWFHLDVPRHLLQFERATLGAMLEAEGFVVERWSTFSAEYDAFGMLQSMLNVLCPTPAWLFQILIGRRTRGTWRDVAVTAVAGVPLAVVAVVASLVAGAAGRGGVLRVTATKPAAA